MRKERRARISSQNCSGKWMLGLEKEVLIFVHAVFSGMSVYGAYTGIRIVRRIFRHTIRMISLEDFLFWVAVSFYLFIQIYETSNGSVRWFFVLGVAAGMISLAFFIRLIEKMWKKIRKSVDKQEKTS